MTRFYDDKELLTITMTGTSNGIDWENEFFEVGHLDYDKEMGAYKVADVRAMADYAKDYANGENMDCEYDFDKDGNKILPDTTCDYTIENLT